MIAELSAGSISKRVMLELNAFSKFDIEAGSAIGSLVSKNFDGINSNEGLTGAILPTRNELICQPDLMDAFNDTASSVQFRYDHFTGVSVWA
jgi:hypothetical protein